jgi:hypothetical protein
MFNHNRVFFAEVDPHARVKCGFNDSFRNKTEDKVCELNVIQMAPIASIKLSNKVARLTASIRSSEAKLISCNKESFENLSLG